MDKEIRVVVWIGNGFAPDGKSGLDEFSFNCRAMALQRHSELVASGYEVWFVEPRSVVRHPDSGEILWTLVKRDLMDVGISENHVKMTSMETTNALQDGVAIARFCKAHQEEVDPEHVEVFVTAFRVARYFTLAYWAGARWNAWNWKIQFQILYPPDAPEIDAKSARTYDLAYWITAAVFWNPLTWYAWYLLRKITDAGRKKGFTVTVDRKKEGQ